jgi:hypothetical membrane protein
MHDTTTKWLLACGAIAGPLFTVGYLVEGATRPNYDPLRHPVSSLALGDSGWTQSANFVVTGLLTLAFAIGVRRALQPRGGSRWGPLLIGVYAIGLLGAGLFLTDPLSGYPPGTPAQPLEYSMSGALHRRLSALVFISLPILCLVFARRFAEWGERGWAIYSAITSVAFVAAFVLSSIAFSQVEPLVEVGGLLQRITLTIGGTWLTLLAVHLLRVPDPRPIPGPARSSA